MGACPSLQQNWRAAFAQLMKVEELCLQLVDLGLHHHNLLAVLLNSHHLQLWEMFHYASGFMAAHLMLKSIQDRFKYLASTHSEGFAAAGDTMLRLGRPFDKTSSHLAKELEFLEISDL